MNPDRARRADARPLSRGARPRSAGAGVRRRDLLAGLGTSGLLAALPAWPGLRAAPVPFGFEQVRARAEELAKSGYAAPEALPETLRALDHAAWRAIDFRRDRAFWDPDGPFQLELVHLGWVHELPALVQMVEGERIEAVPFSAELFDYGENGVTPELLGDIGFAGIRLLRRGTDRAHFVDFASFDGASYFRLIGDGQRYGSSARAIAIDTASAGGEEFPRFREFWLERPAAQADQVAIYALLDSPSLTGAYRFVLRPGVVATTEVTAALYPRRGIGKLGIAPLSSMFLFGENGAGGFDDFRPEVHDADGLLIHNGQGEWIWRPLVNHRSLQISAFLDETPRGFGLFQRDQAFASYQDLQARYHERPSLWVEPIGDWGPGWVELVEIPSEREANDNIVAFWVGRTPVEPGVPLEIAYRVHAQLEQPARPPLGRVLATRIGAGRGPGARRFVLDFGGGPLDGLGADAALEVHVKCRPGEVGTPALTFNPEARAWRTSFDLHPGGEELCELRCSLRRGEETMTEVWTYRWTPA